MLHLYLAAHCPNGKLGAQTSMTNNRGAATTCTCRYFHTHTTFSWRVVQNTQQLYTLLIYSFSCVNNAKELFILIFCSYFLMFQSFIYTVSYSHSFRYSIFLCSTAYSPAALVNEWKSTKRSFQRIRYTHEFEYRSN